MPNFVYITGFEHGESPMAIAGQGLISGSSGNPTLVSGSLARSGDYALFINATGASKHIMLPSARWTGAAGGNKVVGRYYVKFDSFPSSNRLMFVGGMAGVDCSLWYNSTGDQVLMGFDTPGSRLGYTSIVTGTWYRIDFLIDCSTSFYTVDWQLDGVAKAQNWYSGSAAQQFSSTRFGNSGALTYKMYIDDIAFSVDAADYPIGPGRVIGLKPNADGTHNAGTNVMEDQTGADINGTSVLAYTKLNAVPWVTGTSTWVQQAANGTSNYVEVEFEDVPSGVDIHGVLGVLGYKSATTTANSAAGFIINSEGVGSEMWGLPSGTKDYSEINPFYRNTMVTPPAGGWTKTAVDALKARLGYANDANPNPYWLHTLLEVDYADPYDLRPSGIFVNTYVGNPTMSRSGTIAELDFETGDFSAWTNTVLDGGRLGVTGSAALANTAYGMIVNHGGGSTTARYASYHFVQPETNGTVRARFYADPNSFATVGRDGENIFIARNSVDDWLFVVNLGREADNTYYLNLGMYDDSGALYQSSDVAISDGPHWVEVLGRRAAGNNISGGYLQLWVDDVSGTAIQGIDNFTLWNNLNSVRLGGIGSIEATTSGSYYLDELVVNNTGDYIGPKPSGGPTNYSLSGTSITVNTYVGNPYLNQEHGLQASGIYLNTYVGNPYINQEHGLQASGIYLNTYVGNPYLNQEHALAASGIYLNTYVGNPYLNQEHALQASGIFVNTYVGNPYLSQEHALQASGIYLNTYVGNPYINQEHGLTATGITINTYVGNCYVGQEHGLGGNGITCGTTVGNPSLSQNHDLSAVGITVTTHVDTCGISQEHGLGGGGITCGTTVGNPYINQTHVLTANGITVTTYVGNPTLGTEGVMVPSGLTVTTTVGNPYINQTHILGDNGLSSGPTVGNPSMGVISNIDGSGIVVGGDVGDPTFSQTHVFGTGGIGSGPIVGNPGTGQEHIFTIGGITISSSVGNPVLTSPAPSGGFPLPPIFKGIDKGVEKGMVSL